MIHKMSNWIKSQLIKEFIIHSFNDKPSIIKIYRNSQAHEWTKDGITHREGGAAYVYLDKEFINSYWYENGNLIHKKVLKFEKN